MQRIRIKYRKNKISRFTGMLDVQKIWERWLRRAELELEYSKGFHPQPRIHQAAPLPLGYRSEEEIIDIWINNQSEISEIIGSLTSTQPPGFELISAQTVDLDLPSIQTQISSAEYLVIPQIEICVSKLESELGDLLDANSIPRERRGKKYDLRPLIERMEIVDHESSFAIRLLLSSREGATGRPDEVMAALGYDSNDFLYQREKLIFQSSLSNDDGQI